MSRLPTLDKYSYADLLALRDQINALLEERKIAERTALKGQLGELAKQHGFDLDDIIGKVSRRSPVPVKYRDPENSTNTWTGRGRMPRWLAAATKKRGVKKEDFLI